MLEIFATFFIYSTPLEELAQGPTSPSTAQKPKELVLKEGKTLTISQFNFSGNTKITTAQLQRLCSPFLNKSLTENDLSEIEQRVKLLYKSKGYSGVVVTIPAQQKSKELAVVIIEGKKSL